MVTPAPAGSAGGLVRLIAGSTSVALRLERIRHVERGGRISGDTAALTLRYAGGDIPVFALPALLGAAEELVPRTGQVVVTEAGGETVGVWVEKVTPVARATAAKVAPAPPLDRRFADAVLLDDGPLPLLDLERLFRDEPAETPATPRRPNGRVPATARLIVLHVFDHPAPGGRRVGFGVASHQTREIVYLDSVTPIAGDDGVAGWTTWRGRVLPVIDPAAWCGVAAPPADAKRAAVVETSSGRRIALRVGDAVTSLPSSTLHVRRDCWLAGNRERIAGTLEFPGLTAVLPRFDSDPL